MADGKSRGANEIGTPFVFVRHGDPLPLDWMARHPGWIRFPATLVPRPTPRPVVPSAPWDAAGAGEAAGYGPTSRPVSVGAPVVRRRRVPVHRLPTGELRDAEDPVAAYLRISKAMDEVASTCLAVKRTEVAVARALAAENEKAGASTNEPRGLALTQVGSTQQARVQGTARVAEMVRGVRPNSFGHLVAQDGVQAVVASPSIRNSRPHVLKPVSIIPPSVIDALKRAMKDEGIPDSELLSLEFIIAQESEGKVGIPNSLGLSSGLGLFQLTKAAWHYNPRGAASFGEAYEECIGGIRYIKERFGTAIHAETYWVVYKKY